MPDVDTSFYKPLVAPQQQQINPMQALDMIGALTRNHIMQQELQSRQAVGDIYKQSVDENGNLDTDKLSRLAPTTGWYAPEATRAATDNASALTDLFAKYQQPLNGIFGDLSTKASITPQDIAERMTLAAGRHIPGKVVQQYLSSLPSLDNQKAVKDWTATRANLASGPQMSTTLEGGNVNPQTGVRPLVPAGSNVRQAVTGGGIIPELPNGVAGSYIEGQKSLVADQKASAGTLANLRNLDIALPFVQRLSDPNFGPGSPEYAKLRASAATAGIIDPKASDVTIRQELGKYLMKYATLAQNSGRSDQALAAAVGSNPNLDLTQPANLGLIKNQIALDKMDAAMPKLFKVEHPAQEDAAQYNQYKSDYYNKFDRRAFSYDKLTPGERRGLVQSLGPKNSPAYQKFNNTYTIAKKAGIIVPETQQ
jgi:hypothetical protein